MSDRPYLIKSHCGTYVGKFDACVSIRRATQLLISLAGSYFLIGCIYVPSSEHKTEEKQVDFRGLLGPANSGQEIRTGAANCADVIALLGPPPYATRDGREVAYTVEITRGTILWPLWFASSAAHASLYAVRLIFNEKNMLVDFDLVHEDADMPDFPPGHLRLDPYHYGIERLNGRGKELVPASPAGSTTRP